VEYGMSLCRPKLSTGDQVSINDDMLRMRYSTLNPRTAEPYQLSPLADVDHGPYHTLSILSLDQAF